MKIRNSVVCLLVAMLLVALGAAAQELDFLNEHANHITLNGADWGPLRSSLGQPRRWLGGKWSVVHIGDSHVQPDLFTAPVRLSLQDRWGNGGRGLLPVLRLAGTNQPYDYTLSSSPSPRSVNKLLSRSWTAEMGLTGVSAHYADSSFVTLHIAVSGDDNRFSRVTVVHAPNGGYETARVDTTQVLVARHTGDYTSRVDLPQATGDVDLTVPCGSSDLWGALVENDRRGVLVHAIGNNGATASHYNRIDGFAAQIQSVLHPQLIIISLGTNEAFGSLDGVQGQLDRLVTSLRRDCPGATLLLTTPMECHKRVSKKVTQRVPRGRGRRRRYKTITKTVTSFAVNADVRRVRDIILDYGRRHHIATWDLYDIAGGRGAAARWLDAGLMNTGDHLHQLDSGYELQGILLADALLEALTTK